MEPKDLKKILKEVPILLVDGIFLEKNRTWRKEYYQAAGMAVCRERDDGTLMRYTVLDYSCDDMANGLLHESIHHHYKGTNEQFVVEMTELLWKDQAYRKPCQDKIVELCDRWNL